jgi:DNA invertase Pin-like site-specific DNA recombinase
MTVNERLSVDRPAKIQGHHVDRWAIVYVRQSHPQQVLRHRESAQVQANLKDRASAWGWPAERIRVLDGDQGRSGTTTAGRDDFAWLLSEIALGHVGLVLGFQINRLAREDETCCRLIRVCAAFDTLLADQDGLYHPHDFNDRLLLTIKGFMGGVELHQLQQRMQAGRLNRARRGECLGKPLPGYVIGPDRKLQFDPDEQAQYAIRLVLEQFAWLGSVCGVLRYLRQHQIQLPYRPVSGPQRGQLCWRKPNRETLRYLLRHPAYAGVYIWGRRQRRRPVPGPGGQVRGVREPRDCPVFLLDNHPAYISWEQYQKNLRRLKEHRARGPGPGRAGGALLVGLVVCGECGCRMYPQYLTNVRYNCPHGDSQPLCQSFVAKPLEDLVSAQILQVVTPASLELCMRATEECQRQRSALDRQWRLRLERARQDVDRAFRQYNAVEPENRLVARTLERQWEEALLAQRGLEEECHRFQQSQPTELTAAERAQIQTLADDLPALWRTPQTSIADKRQVVRLLLQRVVVWAPRSNRDMKVQLHWTGGTMTEHCASRPVLWWSQVIEAPALLEQVRQRRAAGWSSRRIADELNAAGQRTPRGKPFTHDNVRQICTKLRNRRKKARQVPRRVTTDCARGNGLPSLRRPEP